MSIDAGHAPYARAQMSATVNEKLFSDYYNRAPTVSIPGRTFPVADYYVEDVVKKTNFRPYNWKPSRKYSEDELQTMRAMFAQDGVDEESHLASLCALAKREGIDYDLLAATVDLILATSDEGAILVFLPGVAEIRRGMEVIRSTIDRSVDLLPLHANLSNEDQARVFQPARKGHRKIIVSTNVAETSITIDDVVFVIDSGRVKETRFDLQLGVNHLVEGWVSKSAAKQRRGRAGRTRPGQCWKLYSRSWTEPQMRLDTVPEILRTPLDSLLLQVLAVGEHQDARAFLMQAITPPDTSAVQVAWDTLSDLGAITVDSDNRPSLTPLGAHLSLLPVDLRLGKMLILACIFGCLEPVLTVVAALSSKPLFLSPHEQRDQSNLARMEFATANSDLLTDAAAWATVNRLFDGPKSVIKTFCDTNFISSSAAREILTLRQDFTAALTQAGLVTDNLTQLDVNSANENLVKAIIFAGTGQVARVRLPEVRYTEVQGGVTPKDFTAKEVKCV